MATAGSRTLPAVKQLSRRNDAWPVGSTVVTGRDFATTLHDGRRVVGRKREHRWEVHVYSPERRARLVGYGTALTRPAALAAAGLSGDDSGEVLGRVGI